MRSIAVIATCLFVVVAVSGCSRLSVSDLAGTVWEYKKVDYDYQIGATEMTLRLSFHDRRLFSLKRNERWVRKKAGIKTELPEDSEVAGEYSVKGDAIILKWSDGSALNFTFRNNTIVSHDETRIFVKAIR